MGKFLEWQLQWNNVHAFIPLQVWQPSLANMPHIPLAMATNPSTLLSPISCSSNQSVTKHLIIYRRFLYRWPYKL